MPSVKDLQIEREPTATELGRGRFHFSDAYSVFDWGEMPDAIPGKGASLCSMGASTFETLEAEGVPTHYRGVGPEATPIAEVSEPPNEMAIELTRVPPLPFEDGSYDYEAFHDTAGDNYLIPLEIVFRNRVPIGSSLRRRTEPTDHELDFAEWPDHAVELAVPIVECSTKFEESDRYLGPEEADRIAGQAALSELREIARDVNDTITRRAKAAGLEHLDGKIECLYHQGEIKVADVAGTLDENRFAYEGHQLSKEVIRQYYRRSDSDWVTALTEAKSEAKAAGVADWRTICEREPDRLPENVHEAIADMYGATANAYLDTYLFDAPPLSAVVATIEELEY